MILLSLSPSTQERNLYTDKTTEEANMNKLATDVLNKLKPLSFIRNDPTKGPLDAVRLANQKKVRLHLALHSNAGSGKASGVEAFYDPRKPKSKWLAENMCNTISKQLGIPNRGAKDGIAAGLVEIRAVRKDMDAVLVETFFHDNPSDVKKFHDNYPKLVNELAWQLKVYFGVK